MSTLVRLPELKPRVRELMESLPVFSVAKIVVGALGEFASHDPAEPDLKWETKERDGREAGEAKNSSVVMYGLKFTPSTKYLDMIVDAASLVGKYAVNLGCVD